MTFDTLGLMPESLRAVADQGYLEPTPVQAQAIPVILRGRDLLAGAQTGTGKTAAFVLPMLQRLHEHRGPGPRRVRGLVVVPTRELALQVEESVRTYGAHRPIRSVAIYGGVRMDRQVRALRGGAEIVVATPGRLLDHVRQRTIDLGYVEILVLDEADRMLDMGFIHDIKQILGLLPKERQSLLFSATFSGRIRQLAQELLQDPASIDVAPRNTPAPPIRQLVHPVDKERKRHLLAHMVKTKRIDQVLVFTRTKRGANRLAEQLGKDGIAADAIHGNKSQSQRVRALTSFKNGHSQVLVATDVAARGIDIESLPHVVNFELPTVPEDYVHRIGRTGRAGQDGTAISLVSADERELMMAIEKLLKRSLEKEVVEGFEPHVTFSTEPVAVGRPAQGHGRARQGRGNYAPRRVETRSAPRYADPRRSGSATSVRSAGSYQSAPQGQSRPGESAHALPGERLSGSRSSGPGSDANRGYSGRSGSSEGHGRSSGPETYGGAGRVAGAGPDRGHGPNDGRGRSSGPRPSGGPGPNADRQRSAGPRPDSGHGRSGGSVPAAGRGTSGVAGRSNGSGFNAEHWSTGSRRSKAGHGTSGANGRSGNAGPGGSRGRSSSQGSGGNVGRPGSSGPGGTSGSGGSVGRTGSNGTGGSRGAGGSIGRPGSSGSHGSRGYEGSRGRQRRGNGNLGAQRQAGRP